MLQSERNKETRTKRKEGRERERERERERGGRWYEGSRNSIKAECAVVLLLVLSFVLFTFLIQINISLLIADTVDLLLTIKCQRETFKPFYVRSIHSCHHLAVCIAVGNVWYLFINLQAGQSKGLSTQIILDLNRISEITFGCVPISIRFMADH